MPSQLTVSRCPGQATGVEVTAPCRLHFGLISFGDPTVRQWGGAGMMVEYPAVRLRACPAGSFQVAGRMADRVMSCARRWASFHGLDVPPPCRLEVLDAASAHCGLGTGTQLGLSVAAALNALCGHSRPSPAELAASVERGRRSAVGTYGFVSGGLVVERGKLPGELLAPLEIRLDLPPSWRVVLIRPRDGAGLFGQIEAHAFARLPAVPAAVSEQLRRELRWWLVPAAARGAFDDFSESAYRYGRLAGDCFAAIQGGPYNGQRLERLIARLRDWGIRGVGQSSWGPTVFALLPDASEAARLVERLSEESAGDDLLAIVTRADNRGAIVSRLPREELADGIGSCQTSQSLTA